MQTSGFKKYLSLLLSIIMIFTMIPTTLFTVAAEDVYPVMDVYNSASSGDYHKYYNKVVSVTFLDAIDDNAIADAVESWDVSLNDDAGVMAWMTLNEIETQAAGQDRYDVFIAGDGGVGANPDSSWIFYMFSSLKKINNPENFKTDNATTFYNLFHSCYDLQEIDLSSWNVSKVTTIKNMFLRCFDLTTANLSGWDTSSVTDMSNAFNMEKPTPTSTAESILTSVDLSGWDTSSVTTMENMFYNCKKLTTLDLSSFNTSKVTTMRFMFYHCEQLAHIYVGDGWTTESVANLNDGVFNCCYAIVGGKDIYDANFIIAAPGAEYAKLEKDGGFLTYAPPQPKEYTVTYEFIGDDIPEGVSVVSPTKYEEGSVVTVEVNPTADGYIFSGWTTTDAVVTDGEFTINNNVHFVGSWTKLYNVNYKYADGYEVPEDAPVLPAVSYKAGDAVVVNAIPFVDGYVFVGWNTEDVTVTDGKFAMPEKDVTLYGYFKKPVESVEINGGDIVLNKDGETVINVVVKPEDATVKDIEYKSSDENVVKVDENGKVTAVGVGTATITVFSKDNPTKSDTINVTVKVPVTSITVDKTDVILNEKDSTKLTATVNPDEATNKEVIYESADETVATVDKYGNIKAVSEGETIITVTSKDDPAVKEYISVKVKIPVTEIIVTETMSLHVGEEKNLDAKVNDDATDKRLDYTTSNPGVVKVGNDGNVIAVGKGEATITITSKDDPTKTETVKVTVTVPVEDVIADKNNITLDVGKKDKITVTVTPDDASDKGVTYKSSNTGVVTVDENGNITAVGKGEATITITSKDDPTKTETVKVTVTVPVEDVIADKNNITLDVGKKDKITVTVTPDDASDKGVTYKSSNTGVVTVDENGNITAVGKGEATITITSKDDPTKTETVKVTVTVPVEDVIADKNNITLDVGKKDKITVTVKPDNASDKGVTYKSSNSSVVKVDENGNITAVGKGEATITITSKDDPTKTETVKVTVTVPVEDVIADKNNISLDVGKKDKITVTVKPDNASDKGVTYKSSNTGVVTVDENGNITAVGKGEATITITSKDDPTKTETVKVTVTVPVEPEDPENPEIPEDPENPEIPEDPENPEIPGYIIEVPERVDVFVGEIKNLNVKVTPSEGSLKAVYSSSDESIVTVDADGNITGVRRGSTKIIVEFENGEIYLINVVVTAVPPTVLPITHHVCFGKTDGIGWYEVSVNGGEFFPQGPNSTLEVEHGSVLVIRVQDMWINDEFDFYVNGNRIPVDPDNTITVVVEGYMLIGALSMDVVVPDPEESLTIFERFIKAIKEFFAKIAEFFGISV